MKNPFKFGSVVSGYYFTNRVEEIAKVNSILQSANHLIIISPRRFGKTSLIKKVTGKIKRPTIYLDLQLVTSPEDLAAQLLKKLYNYFPIEKLKHFIKNFRILPTISLNPLNNEVDIGFQPVQSSSLLIEDVFNLIENVSKQKEKIIIVLDEFQEIRNIAKNLDKQLRSIIQHHKKVNYVFLGSQESLMRDIFEKKKSPFYHFGFLLLLDKISYDNFYKYLINGFSKITKDAKKISEDILDFTNSHPYYTQQLAFTSFEILLKGKNTDRTVKNAINLIVRTHDNDFERLWHTLNRTDMKLLIGMIETDITPLSAEFSIKNQIGSSSTIFSSIKRLQQKGIVIKTNNGYEIDDPFFSVWIKIRRKM